jgi:hypothetical protein
MHIYTMCVIWRNDYLSTTLNKKSWNHTNNLKKLKDEMIN